MMQKQNLKEPLKMGTKFFFEEFEVIKGSDDIEPQKYKGKLNGDTIDGSVETTEDDLACNFQLKRIPPNPSREFDFLKPNIVLKGTAYTPYEFELKLSKRAGASFEGEMTWPALEGAKTKVRGTLEGEDIRFEEFETNSKSVAVPVFYTGNIASKNNVGGKFKTSDTNGIFSFKN